MKSTVFNQLLKKDYRNFKKRKTITASRPSEYWLLFCKEYILTAPPLISKIRFIYFSFLIPIIFIGFVLLTEESISKYATLIFFSLFFTFVLVFLFIFYEKHNFIHKNGFLELAKFIISIKGDVYKNLIKVHFNLNRIESNQFSIPLKSLNLYKKKGIKYRPYGLERFKASFRLKDNSLCTASLYQISLKVTTTKRRRSGKVKTKSKYKHKMFYTLNLKLDKKKYNVISQKNLTPDGLNEYNITIKDKQNFIAIYNISIRDEQNFITIKVRYKVKLLELNESITNISKSGNSVFTNMIDFLYKKSIIQPLTNTSILN